MNILVTYDVSTATPEGRRRLRRVAKVCEGFGQRIQYSVFEVVCSQTDLARLIKRLEDEIDPNEDSLRLYPIHTEFSSATHLGVAKELPHDDAWTL